MSTGAQTKAEREPRAPIQTTERKLCSKVQETGTCTSKTSAQHRTLSRSKRTCISFYRARWPLVVTGFKQHLIPKYIQTILRRDSSSLPLL